MKHETSRSELKWKILKCLANSTEPIPYIDIIKYSNANNNISTRTTLSYLIRNKLIEHIGKPHHYKYSITAEGQGWLEQHKLRILNNIVKHDIGLDHILNCSYGD